MNDTPIPGRATADPEPWEPMLHNTGPIPSHVRPILSGTNIADLPAAAEQLAGPDAYVKTTAAQRRTIERAFMRYLFVSDEPGRAERADGRKRTVYAKPEPVRLSAAVQKRLKRQARRRRKAAGAVAVTDTAVRQAGLRAVLDQSLEPLSMCSVDAGDPMRVPAPLGDAP